MYCIKLIDNDKTSVAIDIYIYIIGLTPFERCRLLLHAI